MSQRIGRSQSRQRQRRANRLFQPPRIAQRPNQPVVPLNVSGISRNRRAKSLRSLSRRSGGKQVQTSLAELIGGVCIGCGHGCL
jgi:hypothetical protein